MAILLIFGEYSFTPSVLCKERNVDISCVQDWSSSIIGLAATVVAGVTARYIYLQFKEARRQSDFALGFSKPTAYMYDKTSQGLRDFNANVVNVVNWNRYPVVFTSMRLIAGGKATIAAVKCDGAVIHKNAADLPAIVAFFKFIMPGWEDHSSAPPRMTINIKLDDPQASSSSGFLFDRAPLQLQLTGRIIGPTHEKFSLMVERPDAIVN